MIQFIQFMVVRLSTRDTTEMIVFRPLKCLFHGCPLNTFTKFAVAESDVNVCFSDIYKLLYPEHE